MVVIVPGRLFVVLGVFLILLGFWVQQGGGFGWFGQLPGDLIWSGDNVTIYLPITSSLLISLVLSLIFWFLR